MAILFPFLHYWLGCTSYSNAEKEILIWFLWGVPHTDKMRSFLILSRYHFSEKLVGSPASSHYDLMAFNRVYKLTFCRCWGLAAGSLSPWHDSLLPYSVLTFRFRRHFISWPGGVRFFKKPWILSVADGI